MSRGLKEFQVIVASKYSEEVLDSRKVQRRYPNADALELVLVPKPYGRAPAPSAAGIGVALTTLLRRERVQFAGYSVRITVEPVLACRVCGCTEDTPCIQRFASTGVACAWNVEKSEGPDVVCTRCAP